MYTYTCKLDVSCSFSTTLLALFHISLLVGSHKSPRQEAFEKIGAVEQQAWANDFAWLLPIMPINNQWMMIRYCCYYLVAWWLPNDHP